MRNRHGVGWLLVGVMVVGLAVPVLAGLTIFSKGDLRDLGPTVTQATDGGVGVASATVLDDRTIVRLTVRDLDTAAAGTTFGAHVHVGPCVAGDGAAALGHYNAGGGISAETEVWLDFTVTPGGTGHAVAIVPFAIDPGSARSIVIHALPTAADGSAGARMACIPLEF